MGLLEKRNPRATRRSLIAWAVGGAIVCPLYGLFRSLLTDFSSSDLWLMLPWMTVWGAVAGAALEWQMPTEKDGSN